MTYEREKESEREGAFASLAPSGQRRVGLGWVGQDVMLVSLWTA